MSRGRRWGFCLLLLAGACTSATDGDGSDRPLLIFAAASLTEVFPRIDAGHRYQFAGSDQLALQIEEGAPADVFASAGPRYTFDLSRQGLVTKPEVFATNRLVLIVPEHNPAAIESVSDLDAPGVKLVVGAEGVPVGDYTRAALAAMGEEDVLANVVSEEQDVRGVMGKVALGEADAGFVYATDVAAADEEVLALELPPLDVPRIEYTIAVVGNSDLQHEAAEFVSRVLSDRGRRVLTETGFGLP